MKQIYSTIIASVLAALPSQVYAHNAPEIDAHGRYVGVTMQDNSQNLKGAVQYSGTSRIPFGVVVSLDNDSKRQRIMNNERGQTVVTLADVVTETAATLADDGTMTSTGGYNIREINTQTFICPNPKRYCTTSQGNKVLFADVKHKLAPQAFSVLKDAIQYNKDNTPK